MSATVTRSLPVLGALLLSVFATPAFAVPEIESWQTTNGARVMFVAAPEIPMLDVRVVFAAGSARDDGRAGLANLTNALLDEGAGDLDADAFTNAVGQTGARLQTGALRDMAFAEVRTLIDSEYRKPALALLRQAIAEPRFDDQAIERVKARTMIALRHKKQSPGAIAEENFYASVYPRHPYGSPTDGTEESVAGLSRADVVAFHERYYVARNAVIAIVGAIDTQQAGQIAESLSTGLDAGEAAPALPEVEPPGERELRVEFPSIQSHVRVGLPGMVRGDPDYFPLLVGNHALGGNSLVSILFREIRGKRGLSYSAYSYFIPMSQPGPFVAALQTDRSQEAEAMQVLRATLAGFIEDGPPDADLQSAKQNLIGGFPLRIDSNDKIVEYIAMIGFHDLPLDYLETFAANVAAVDAQAVRDAFQRRISPERLITVIVGRSETDG